MAHRLAYIGNTVTVRLGPVFQADGTTPLDLTSLAMTFALRKRGSSAAAFTWTKAGNPTKFAVSGDDNNIVTVTMSASDTAIAAGYYDSTIGITDGSGVVKNYPDAQSGPVALEIRATAGP